MKKLIPLILLFSLSACAQPHYISANDLREPQGSQSEDTCSLKFTKAGICAEMQWLKAPSSSDYSEFTLKFNSPQITAANLSVVLWMPSMGHGSAPVKIEDLGQGQFRVYNVYFVMPGEWEVRVNLKNQSATVDQVFVPLMVP